LDPKVDRAALEAVSHRLRTVKWSISFPLLFCFCCYFSGCFGRLDPFGSRLMYLSVLFSTFWPVSVTQIRGGTLARVLCWQLLREKRKREKTQAKLTLRINPDSPARLSSASKCPHSTCRLPRRTIMIPGLDCLAARDKKSSR